MTSAQPQRIWVLSDIQSQIVISQKAAPSSTAYIQTILVPYKKNGHSVNIDSLAEALLQQFPILRLTLSQSKLEFELNPLSEEYLRSIIFDADDDNNDTHLKNLFRIENRKSHSQIAIHIHQLLVDTESLQIISKFAENWLSGAKTPGNPKNVLPPSFLSAATNAQNADELELQLTARFEIQEHVEFATFLQLQHQHSQGECVQEMESCLLSLAMNTLDYKEIMEKYGATPAEYFLGCFLLTIRRYVGAEHPFSYCTPISTRDGTNKELVGPFYNILPIGVDLSAPVEVDSFFKYVKDDLEFFEKVKAYPYSTLISSHQIQSYYTHMFTYEQDVGSAVLSPPKNPTVAFSLKVGDNFMDENGNITTKISLEWGKPLLDSQVARFFLLNFINCCEKLRGDNFGPKVQIDQLDIMCQEEKEFLQSFTTFPARNVDATSVLSLFESNVKRNPESIAIFQDPESNPCKERKDATSSYTYGQLDQASSAIGAALRGRFTEADRLSKPIALLMEKNFECVAAVLGVWKAGGHFIPLDIDVYSKHLSNQAGNDNLCVITNLKGQNQAICIHDLMDEGAEAPATEYLLQNNSLAYVTMTSGSTGIPKKCKISHEALLQFSISSRETFSVENINVLQWAPFSFDVFLGDFVKALISSKNGALTLLPSSQRMDVPSISRMIKTFKINFFQTTPNFALFALEQEPELMASVKTLILGGEPLKWNTLREIRRHLPKESQVWSVYGLTEATVESTAYLTSSEELPSLYVPLGHPLPGIPIFIADPHTKLQMPLGASGILAIAGETVGSGDVEVCKVDKRLVFLTGDTASLTPKGLIHFHGRNDADCDAFIKLKGGLRIHCGEIQRALIEFPGAEIAQAQVLPVDVGKDEQILGAIIYSPQGVLDIPLLLNHLKAVLPLYLVPQTLIQLKEFPLTKNGKVDRKLLATWLTTHHNNTLTSITRSNSKEQEHIDFQQSSTPPMTKTERFLVEILKNVYTGAINVNSNLRDLGITSFQLMKYSNLLVKEHVKNFQGTSDLFTFPTIHLLARHIDGNSQQKISQQTETMDKRHKKDSADEDDPICIVGLSLRLPGDINSIASFWENIQEGKCFVRDFPAERKQQVLGSMLEPFTSEAVRASFFSRVDQFDHEFFNIAPSEAKNMCPEQRVFLEMATEALVDSGYTLGPSLAGANIGVYCTASDIEYGLVNPKLDGVAVVGRQSSVVPSRVSYTYNLSGGNYVVDTACSAALVVLEQAVRDLRFGACESAIVGGVNIYLYPAQDGLMGTNLIHSASANCLPFDQEADGTVSGEGAFAYVLMRKSTAVLKGCHIYATIESCSSNAVGRGNGITAPSVDSQVSVIEKCLDSASLSVDDIHFLETHGTGTVLGDQIELCALATAFAQRKSELVIGATKQNFGHLDMAAGFLSMLKAISVLTFQKSPKMRQISKPSRYLDGKMFRTESDKIEGDVAEKLYGGISAYGLSGTNCHAVISVEAENRGTLNQNQEKPALNTFVMPIFPDTKLQASLEDQCASYSKYAGQFASHVNIGDICATQIANLVNAAANEGKTKLSSEKQKFFLLQVSSTEDLIKKLNAIRDGVVVPAVNQIQALNSAELNQLISGKSWKRVPALPKFMFKKFAHWVDPVEPRKLKTKENKTSEGELTSFLSLFENKIADIDKLVETAQQLQKMVNQFSFSVMRDLMPGHANQFPQKSNHLSQTPTTVGSASLTPTPTLTPKEDATLENLTYQKTLETVKTIWEDCLGLSPNSEDLTPSSIFRDLGGDSLLTIQMTKIVSSHFGLKDLKAAAAFAHPTLAAYSALIFTKHTGGCPEDDLIVGMPQKMLMFPGQGSQKLGMCLSGSYPPQSLKLFQEAKEITGIDILEGCSNQKSFESTEFVQVALFVGSLAKAYEIQENSPETLEGLRTVGGLSVGEFAALVFAGALDFEDALKIVHFRGKAMQEAIHKGDKTGMVSIFGPTPTQFADWMNSNGFSDMEFSTLLGDNQFTVGGPMHSCERLLSRLAEADESERLGIIDSRLLRVAGAFHTKYMHEAALLTAKLIDQVKISFPRYGIVMNADGQVAMNKESIRFNLKEQTTKAVLWREAVIQAHDVMAIRKFIEISPSSVLTPIVKGRIKGIGRNCDVQLFRF